MLATKSEGAHHSVDGGGRACLGDPGFELRLGRAKEKKKVRT